MNYPNITIQARKFVLSIVFKLNEQESRTMFVLNPNLDQFMSKAAEVVGYKSETNTLAELLSFARSGDENFMEFAKLDVDNDGLETAEIMNGVIKAAKEKVDEYVEANDEIKKTLDLFWQADMLASILEEIYALVIAKAVFNASELGINTIVLDDDFHEVRLQEKVGKEITAVPEIELVVV